MLADKPSIAAELVMHCLDKAGLVEHGSYVHTCWLTANGDDFLELLTKFKDDPVVDCNAGSKQPKCAHEHFFHSDAHAGCEWFKSRTPHRKGLVAMTPTRRTLQYLRNLGFRCAVVEHYNAHTRRRHDLFGFGDVLAIKEGITLLVQVTSGSNLAARRHKILNECPHEAKDWLAAGNEIELHGWRKLAQYRKDGTRAKRDKWEVRLDSITPVDFWEN